MLVRLTPSQLRYLTDLVQQQDLTEHSDPDLATLPSILTEAASDLATLEKMEGTYYTLSPLKPADSGDVFFHSRSEDSLSMVRVLSKNL